MFDYVKLHPSDKPRLCLNECSDSINDYVDCFDFTKAPYIKIKGLKNIRELKSKKFIYNIKRSQSYLESNFKFAIKTIHDYESPDECINVLINIFKKKWKWYNSSSPLTKKKSRENFKNQSIILHEENKLDIRILILNDIPIGYSYSIIHNNNYYVYLLGTLSDYHLKGHSFIKLLIYHTISFAIEINLEIYDFMCGNEKYKYEWASDAITVKYIVRTNKIFPKFIHNIHIFYLDKYFKYKRRLLSLFRGNYNE